MRSFFDFAEGLLQTKPERSGLILFFWAYSGILLASERLKIDFL